jgi:hypothetical protein
VTAKGKLVDAPSAVGSNLIDINLNEWQIWILAELRRTGRLCRCDVEKRCRCSGRTATRDLAVLRAKGLIEFVNDTWPEHDRLTQFE